MKTTKSNFIGFTLGLLMLGAAVAAWAMHPRTLMSEQRAKTPLATLIPTSFGDWKELPQSGGQIVNPQQTAILEEIYSETLSRVYVNSNGAAIMLSLAYGANQSRDLQIHRPEVCYSAQGFQIISTNKTSLTTTSGSVPAMQLVAKLGQRNEPITYWVRIGEKVVRGNLEQGFARMQYGLNGVVADGILFRVSSIATDNGKAYATQQQFIDDLLKSVPEDTRAYLLGKSTS
ncbi:exosortase-associated protein EpsI, B-type [Rhodoferax bucti]|uniref:exosortase-associated protein EpsI, B-type n=1 Tax=Rhodoferax bucti TaxID=2576305 RepID=UPI0011084CE9|nr:exosortase-associated protein EpsI, B-type [Rhodoferax bucti]